MRLRCGIPIVFHTHFQLRVMNDVLPPHRHRHRLVHFFLLILRPRRACTTGLVPHQRTRRLAPTVNKSRNTPCPPKQNYNNKQKQAGLMRFATAGFVTSVASRYSSGGKSVAAGNKTGRNANFLSGGGGRGRRRGRRRSSTWLCWLVLSWGFGWGAERVRVPVGHGGG